MSKVIILGDTHWGCRNDLQLFYQYFDKFYQYLVQYMVDNKINTVFQLGDLFDRRKYINFRTLSESKKIMFDRFYDNNIDMHVLVGNHDIHMKESTEINSPRLLIDQYDNITVYDTASTLDYYGTSIDIIPWLCKENEESILEMISTSSSELCFGHFEIQNFSMYKGIESHDGLPEDLFQRYELVCSGHYHTRSHRENIVYVGTPYEMTWQDYNDTKGFHVFDTQTRQLEFIINPYTIFSRIDYDDTEHLPETSRLDIKDKFCRLVVRNKTDPLKFDNFIQRLYNKGPYELKIIEDLSEFTDGEIGDEINLENTIDVLSNYIDSIETTANKDKIKAFMKTLYIEAVNAEVV